MTRACPRSCARRLSEVDVGDAAVEVDPASRRGAVLDVVTAHLPHPLRLQVQRLAREQGYRTMLEDGLAKASSGWTTPEEVLKAVYTQALD